MATTAPSTLDLSARAAEGSRSARRLRRTGQVPGIIYGGGEDPELFAVDARILRNTLAHAGAILQVTVGGGAAAPVLVKDVQRHPVRGDAMHLDLLRVNMDETIHTTVTLHLIGADVAPGVMSGGVLSQGIVELNIEALPGDIPDEGIDLDVSGMEINDTVTLSTMTPPRGVTLLDDPDTVVATLTPPTLEPVEEEIETETERVGDPTADATAERQAEGDTSSEAAQATDG